MAPKLHEAERTCIVCRERFAQKRLLRLQCQNKQLIPFSGMGRSFYLCDSCFDIKQTSRALARQCKSGAIDTLMSQLKEIIVDVRKS